MEDPGTRVWCATRRSYLALAISSAGDKEVLELWIKQTERVNPAQGDERIPDPAAYRIS